MKSLTFQTWQANLVKKEKQKDPSDGRPMRNIYNALCKLEKKHPSGQIKQGKKKKQSVHVCQVKGTSGQLFPVPGAGFNGNVLARVQPPLARWLRAARGTPCIAAGSSTSAAKSVSTRQILPLGLRGGQADSQTLGDGGGSK